MNKKLLLIVAALTLCTIMACSSDDEPDYQNLYVGELAIPPRFENHPKDYFADYHHQWYFQLVEVPEQNPLFPVGTFIEVNKSDLENFKPLIGDDFVEGQRVAFYIRDYGIVDPHRYPLLPLFDATVSCSVVPAK